jgi:hypothetical protein
MVNRSGRERNNPPPPPRRRQPRQAAQQAQQGPQDPQDPPVVPPVVPPPPQVQPPPVVANVQPPPVVPPPVVLNPQQVIMDRLLQAAGFNDRARAVLVSPQQEALTIDLLQTWKDHTVENTARTLRKTQVNVQAHTSKRQSRMWKTGSIAEGYDYPREPIRRCRPHIDRNSI